MKRALVKKGRWAPEYCHDRSSNEDAIVFYNGHTMQIRDQIGFLCQTFGADKALHDDAKRYYLSRMLWLIFRDGKIKASYSVTDHPQLRKLRPSWVLKRHTRNWFKPGRRFYIIGIDWFDTDEARSAIVKAKMLL